MGTSDRITTGYSRMYNVALLFRQILKHKLKYNLSAWLRNNTVKHTYGFLVENHSSFFICFCYLQASVLFDWSGFKKCYMLLLTVKTKRIR